MEALVLRKRKSKPGIMRRFKLPPQILRLVLLTLAIVGSYLVARAFLTPASFGELGWYRANALAEIRSRTPVYAGKQACDECHSDILHKLEAGVHKTLSCESCHGACREHADNPDVPPARLAENFCLRCHEANPSRPKWFNQIVAKDHYPGKCTECHMPHQPAQTP
jgi:hypothetical protein